MIDEIERQRYNIGFLDDKNQSKLDVHVQISVLDYLEKIEVIWTYGKKLK